MKLEDIEVRQFKLISGEDIVAYVNTTEETGYVLERPIRVIEDDDAKGYLFVNWLNMCEFNEPIYLSINNVVASGNCNDTIKEKYLQAVTETSDSQASPDTEGDFDDDIEIDSITILH